MNSKMIILIVLWLSLSHMLLLQSPGVFDPHLLDRSVYTICPLVDWLLSDKTHTIKHWIRVFSFLGLSDFGFPFRYFSFLFCINWDLIYVITMIMCFMLLCDYDD